MEDPLFGKGADPERVMKARDQCRPVTTSRRRQTQTASRSGRPTELEDMRWAVMEEGRGRDHWLETEHIFQSDSREAAFAGALRIGRNREYVVVPGSRPRHEL